MVELNECIFQLKMKNYEKNIMIFGKQKKTIFLRNLSKITNMNCFCIIRKSGKFLQAVAKKTILNQNLFKKGLSSQLIVQFMHYYLAHKHGYKVKRLYENMENLVERINNMKLLKMLSKPVRGRYIVWQKSLIQKNTLTTNAFR